ncbi:DUF3048 domain-containing protein [Paenibacillus sp. PR3]|uniref:DUF3048 domain-containing protein n=1 Tax=Paenibacillus terricola TaxID=2763503 RepID=A0ABR8MYL8_9BACL|nr:DUF3048 domain-containing protein [Paenibacillus terricola]MBD3921026.1 DUF3048 domain-containing protein [Paenibacillus terricola]
MMTKRAHQIAALLLVAALGLTACGSSSKGGTKSTVTDPAPSDTQQQTNTTSEPPAPVSSLIAPLTGLPADQELKQRPIAVSVNNFKAARPQSGLTQADIVWEVLAEGGITRLIAVFQSSTFTDPIGPIRSIRPYLIDIAESYKSVIVHAGASTDAYDLLQHHNKDYLDEITNAGPYYWRDKTRKAPHNLYSDLTKMRAGADKKKYQAEVTIPTVPFAAEGAGAYDGPATNIDIKFLLEDYKVSYAYDAAKNLYMRSINGEPHIDKNNDEQLSAANVVVLGADHKTLDDYGRLGVNLTSGGKAVLFQNGQAVACEWTRQGTDIIRIMKDGKELPMLPGHTYYHIVPNNPTFEKHLVYG